MEKDSSQVETFNQVIDSWLIHLANYTSAEWKAKPSPTSWSIGQLYQHLIEVTAFHFGQIRICLSDNSNALQEASPEARKMFAANEFPNQLIEGPPSNDRTPQPETKEQIRDDLVRLKHELNNEIIEMFETSSFFGKTRHPGLLFFNAYEWLQFSAMHMRHHLRQKRRIDDFLSRS